MKLTLRTIRLSCALVFVPMAFALGVTRAIDKDQLPIRYSPAADQPVSGREMQNGSATYIQETPWALPTMKYKSGMLATRALDSRYMKLKSVRSRYNYFSRHSFQEILESRDANERAQLIAGLSPAEKYDLVLGDLDRHFSKAIWKEVLSKFARGEVPGWYGLCDGSSAASVLFPEPSRNIVVPSRLRGIDVPFYIGDIKALLAYSLTTYVARDLPIVGERCEKKQPDVSKGECFGINPASLHQILMQMSLSPERFPYLILDRSPGQAIWNSAVLSASFSYYDPHASRAVSSRAIDHLVDVDRFRSPRGSPGWAPGAKYLLFTKTTLRLADTRTNAGFTKQGKMEDLYMTIKYVLELNANLDVLGGEWLSHLRPNFIWALPKDYRPASVGDRSTAGYQWTGVDVPEAAMPLVLKASRAGQPVFRVVDFIYKQSLN